MTFCRCRYKHAGVKRDPPLITGSSPPSPTPLKMFSLRTLRDSMARTSSALQHVSKDTPGLAALVNTQVRGWGLWFGV